MQGEEGGERGEEGKPIKGAFFFSFFTACRVNLAALAAKQLHRQM